MKKIVSLMLSFIFAFLISGCSIYYPKEVDFSELKFTAFGDSITYGADLKIGGRVENPYPTVVSELLGLKSYENKGVSGATYTSNNLNLPCMSDVITSYSAKADIIGVLGGVNDYNRSLPLGDIEDNDITTVYGIGLVSYAVALYSLDVSFFTIFPLFLHSLTS